MTEYREWGAEMEGKKK